MAIYYDPYGSGKYSKGAINVIHRGKHYSTISSLAKALEREAGGTLSSRSATASAVHMANSQSGNSAANKANLANSKAVLKQKADARHSGAIGRKIIGLAGGLTAAGIGASLAPSILGGSGITGVAAGNAPATGLGSTILNNFSVGGALKNAVLGAGSSLINGGDPLKSGLIGGLTGGFAPGLSGSLELSGAGAQAFERGLTSAGLGYGSGGIKGALTGGALGAAGGYISGGGSVPGLGNVTGASLDQVSGVAGLQGPTQGSGVLGSLSNITSSIGSAGGGGVSALTGSGAGGIGGLGGLIKGGAGIYDYYQGRGALDDAEDEILRAQQQAIAGLRPYQQTGLQAQQDLAAELSGQFAPGDLTQDPGYQFQLQEGQKALDRQLAAQGLGQSGAAIKAAAQYSQGLADQTYQDAYNRWLASRSQNISGLGSLANQGLGTAQNIAGLQAGIGQTRADAELARAQERSRLLGSLFGGGSSSLGGTLLGSIF